MRNSSLLRYDVEDPGFESQQRQGLFPRLRIIQSGSETYPVSH